jgi:uncharacterized membrane protein YraQ (UPF0718 family)
MLLNKLAIKQAGLKTLNGFSQFLPILLGMLLLISLLIKSVPKNFYLNLFSGNSLFDSLIGAMFGGIATGNPLTSYIIGGELRSQGISLIPITAFMVTWVTVGTIQLPAEIMMLGKRFAVTRYLVSFVLAMAVAVLTVLTLNIL